MEQYEAAVQAELSVVTQTCKLRASGDGCLGYLEANCPDEATRATILDWVAKTKQTRFVNEPNMAIFEAPKDDPFLLSAPSDEVKTLLHFFLSPFPFPLTEEQAEIGLDDHCVLLLDADGKVIGYGIAEVDNVSKEMH